MLKNGKIYFKKSRFLKNAWPFFYIMNERVKICWSDQKPRSAKGKLASKRVILS